MYKSCPTLVLSHTNVSTAVVEAAVSWIIAWRLLGFHTYYETIQTSLWEAAVWHLDSVFKGAQVLKDS